MHGAMGTVSEDALSELIDHSRVRDLIVIPFFRILYFCAEHQGILLDLAFRFFNSFLLRAAFPLHSRASCIRLF